MSVDASPTDRGPRGEQGAKGARGPLVVLVLGILSTVGLFGASALDFGDPRVEARANAAQAVATRTEGMLLRWAKMRRADAPPPGAGPGAGLVLTHRPAADWRAPFELPAASDRPSDPVFEVLLDMALAALHRGNAEAGLGALEDALRDAPRDVFRREEALYAAARAASALGRPLEVEGYRSELLACPGDAMVLGTSAKLLVHWVKPRDAAGAHGLLLGGAAILPAPKDSVQVRQGGATVELDPWWEGLGRAMTEAEPDLDWPAAFRTEERRAAALVEFASVRGLIPSKDWSFTDLREVPLAVREVDGETLVARVDRAVFEAAWSLPARSGDPIAASAVARQEGAPGATPLAGSPYSLRVWHTDPEGSAGAQVRRIRWLRGGLFGLGALVLVASVSSFRLMSRSRRLAELRSTFVSSVSHDLRTPTQAILLMSEMLEADLVPDGKQKREYQSQIRREAQRLRRMVEDLLDGGRIDRGGGARIVRTDVATGPFLKGLEHAMGERAQEVGAGLRFTRGDMPKSLFLDGDGVHRVLWNLFENALLHGHAPGVSADVAMHLDWTDGVLRLSVEDAGPSVPDRHRETVFGAFERLGDRAKSADGIATDTGTGLGLAIVRAIARAHGGDARVVPKEGPGARFEATFPTRTMLGDAE